MKRIISFLFIIIILVGCTMFEKRFIVGKNISIEDINEFYYTYSTSTNPAEYQRYHFYKQDNNYYFFHDYRTGSAFPLSEKYRVRSDRINIDEDKWKQLYSLLEDGIVTSRKENIESGSSGPWLYLYWKSDKNKYQEFSFKSYEKLKEFEEFCKSMIN